MAEARSLQRASAFPLTRADGWQPEARFDKEFPLDLEKKRHIRQLDIKPAVNIHACEDRSGRRSRGKVAREPETPQYSCSLGSSASRRKKIAATEPTGRRRRSPMARNFRNAPQPASASGPLAAQAIAKLQQAIALHRNGHLEAARAIYDEILKIQPRQPDALHLRGVIAMEAGDFRAAADLIHKAININSGSAAYYNNYGNALKELKKLDAAVASYDKAIGIRPDFAVAYNNRGLALSQLKKFDAAISSFDQAISIKPDFADAYCNRGDVQQENKQWEAALVSYDKAIGIRRDDARAYYTRGNVLRRLKRLEAAIASFETAIKIRPDFSEAYTNLGHALFADDRIEAGLAAFRRAAELVYGNPATAARRNASAPPHKLRHDREQRDYLAGGHAQGGPGLVGDGLHIEGGGRMATAAVNPVNADDVVAQWRTSKPQVVVIDDFLTDAALGELRRFCLGSTVWQEAYDGGYIGAFPEHGFACPLLGQIADELRGTFPAILQSHPLRYLWAFKYDSRLSGINIHADLAAVNVNFWITPDDANLDPDHGGLVVWDVAAPLDWDFPKYNNDSAAARDFLARSGAKSVTVPYRANRAVIFDSDLFHETDKIVFQDGYHNRRINVTLLYGWRETET